MKKKKIFLMITDGGGGHRGTANSLKHSIESMNLPWEVRIVNLYKEVLDESKDNMVRTSISEDTYNVLLKHNQTKIMHKLKYVAHGLVKIFSKRWTKEIKYFMAKEKPDFVLSIMPFVNDIFVDSLSKTEIPLGLLLSDLVDTKPYMWLTPKICKDARFIAVGCQEATEQYSGKDKSKVVNSGLVIHKKHFDMKMSKGDARKYLKLDDIFTLTMVTGGYGGSIMKDFIKLLEKSKKRIQIIACCGKNEELKKEIESMKTKNKIIPVGFTNELHVIMRASDVVFTKPGPASIMESIAVHTPLILYDAKTMPQEVPNSLWAKKNKFALIIKDKAEIPSVVNKIISEREILEEIQERMVKYNLEDSNKIVIDLIKKEL